MQKIVGVSFNKKGRVYNFNADGFDLKKEPFTILKAYNDRAGLTRDFNLNLLRRIKIAPLM